MFVDPKKDNFYNYTGATLFKPNKKEAEEALDIKIEGNESLLNAGESLLKKLGCQNLLITLGADGMMLFEAGGDVSSVPTIARNVADVSGAGDTAIATIAAAMAGGASSREASYLANYASGIVCQEPGIVSITKESLEKAIKTIVL